MLLFTEVIHIGRELIGRSLFIFVGRSISRLSGVGQRTQGSQHKVASMEATSDDDTLCKNNDKSGLGYARKTNMGVFYARICGTYEEPVA